jgi:hypothetical protein
LDDGPFGRLHKNFFELGLEINVHGNSSISLFSVCSTLVQSMILWFRLVHFVLCFQLFDVMNKVSFTYFYCKFDDLVFGL